MFLVDNKYINFVSVSLCHLIGELRSLIFKITTERHVLTAFITLLIFDYAVRVLNGSFCFSNTVLFVFLIQSVVYAQSFIQSKTLFSVYALGLVYCI